MSLEKKINWDKIKWKEVKHLYIPPIIFYETHYKGLTIGELNNNDLSLYKKLKKKVC